MLEPAGGIIPFIMPEMVTLVSVGGKIIAVPGTQLRITDYFSASRVPWSENRSSIDVCVRLFTWFVFW